MARATDTEASRASGTSRSNIEDGDDVYFHEDEQGWIRQDVAWKGEGVYVVVEENHLQPGPEHRAVNQSYGLGISLTGAYRRRVRGTEQVVDCNTGFLRFDGDEVGVEHFTGDPGMVTFVGAEPAVNAGWFERVADVPAFTVTPAMALTHLRLSRAHRLGADTVTLESLALDLVGAAVSQHEHGIHSYARRTTAESRRRLVTQACELLHVSDRKIGLVEIARTVGCSPFHLSRVFHEITGLTIPQYRKRLRIHDALRLLNDGEDDLASIAVATGFADHSHMTRSIVSQYGDPPSRLRDLMRVYAETSRLLPR